MWYIGPTSKSGLVDGAIVDNNPLYLTNTERASIWKRGTDRADMFLSLGTGIRTDSTHHSNLSGKGRLTSTALKFMPSRVKEKTITGYHQELSALRSNRKWQQFIKANQKDSRFVEVCHRLDLPLTESPPKPDEYQQMDKLREKTASYFDSKYSSAGHYDSKYRFPEQHIKAVARRLTASLFYFEEVSAGGPTVPVPPPGEVKGFLRCRLGPKLKSQFGSLVGSDPTFRLREEGSESTMIGYADFDKTTFSTMVSFHVNTTSWVIEVSFPAERNTWEAIGGFS
jgi:hypothetical protein